jgi:hypothetical protein
MRVFLLLSLVARGALAADGGSTAIGSNYLNCRVEQSGLTDGGAQFVITVLPLPVDAARASKQPDLGAPGRPSFDVLSVQGVPFGKPLKVDASGVPVQVYGLVSIDDAGSPLNINPPVSLPLPTGASTAARQDTGNTSLSSIDAQLALIKAKTDNIDVLFSTRTKPSDQQHVIIDTIPTTTVTGPLTDTQIRASPLPVSGTVTASGPITDTQLRATPVPVSGTVALSSTPLPVGAATDSTLSQLLDGGVAALGRQPDGTLRPIAVDSGGVVFVNVVQPARVNPFLMPCTAVRRFNCR